MDCPSCGIENRSEASFCRACGESLAQVANCAQCGHSNTPDSRFCESCGGALDSSADRSPSAVPEPPAQQSPTSFASGRYRVGRFLGEGAKKRVYLARDERLGRDVVVGLIKNLELDDKQRTRVELEARAMGQLGEHPHTVNIYDVGDEGGQLYVVAQYVDGGDLEQRLNAAPERRLPIAEAVRIAGELCAALEHAHANGVIHRDIKPGNIYLGADDGTVKLGDFGLAVAFDRTRLTQDGMLVGTPSYMAPELALGRSAEARTDIYALGATLYEMVVGRPPFVGDDAVSIISQHINTRPVSPSWHRDDVPQALETLILRLLEKDLDARPESAADVARDLSALSRSAASAEIAVPETPDNPLAGLSLGVFVGREQELDNLRSALDQSLSGRGQLRMLVGEPGAGKTRTAQEFTTYAGLRGAQVLWGRCYEGEGAPSYWPWRQIIRSYVHAADTQTLASEMGPGAADIADLVSDVRERLPGLPIPPALDSNQARFRLWDSITTFLRNASNRQPLVLVVDDMHRADEPSLLLFQFLARELAGHRILVLGTYRDVELRRQHPLSAVLAELSREALFERVLLRGLSRDDVERFIEGTTQTRPPPGLADAVHRETEGNPFFTHEVVRLLAQQGGLDAGSDASSWSHAIPQGVREVVGHRLDALSDQCNALLAIGSAFGREFDLDVLARVSGLPEDAALEGVEEALAVHLVDEVPDSVGHYQFSHALVQQTLYEEHSTTRRVRLHRRVGEVLEELYAGRLDPHLPALAYHFAEAAPGGDVEKAIDYGVRAAEQSVAALAHEDAVLHYQRALQALDLLSESAPAKRCELLLALAEAHWEAGAAQASLEAAEQAEAMAQDVDPVLTARAAIAAYVAGTFTSLDQPSYLLRLEAALAALPETAVATRARTLAAIANMRAWLGDPRAQEESLESVELARQSDDPDVLIEALKARHAVTLWPDHSLEERLQVVEELARVDPYYAVRGAVFGPNSHFDLLLTMGDGAAAEEMLGEMERQAAEMHSEIPIAVFVSKRGQLDLLRGDFAACERAMDEVFRTGRRFGAGLMGQGAGMRYGLYRERGRLAEIEDELNLNILRRIPESQIALYRSSRAAMFTEIGRLDDAREELEQQAANGFADFRDSSWLMTLGFLGEACAALGDVEKAEQLYRLLEPCANQNTQLGTSCWTPVARILGLLAATLGRDEIADSHFAAALQMCDRLESPPLKARTELDYAEVLFRRGETDDLPRVRALGNSSLAVAERLGMQGLIERALTLKLESDGIVSTDPGASLGAVASAVAVQRPDLRGQAGPDGSVTLMFSDIEDYTGLLERLGDVGAHQLVQEHNGIVHETVSAGGGYEVELRGDGFLLAFAGPLAAVGCAVDLQRRFADRNAGAETPIRIRIGLHTGETIRDAEAFFGKSVVEAFRIADLADGGEILVSEDTRNALPADADVEFDAGRDVELKGLKGVRRVYGVKWSINRYIK